jgi:biopolymer transport protein ExbD
MTKIPLRFVWNKVSGHGRRSGAAGLNLVSFIDFLVVTVIFLLMSFSASGALAGSTRAVEELGRMQKIDELFNLLKNKRELWKQVSPNKPFPGVCILQVDQNVSALVVKSVFQTAAFAGYPNVSFMVGKLPKSK